MKSRSKVYFIRLGGNGKRTILIFGMLIRIFVVSSWKQEPKVILLVSKEWRFRWKALPCSNVAYYLEARLPHCCAVNKEWRPSGWWLDALQSQIFWQEEGGRGYKPQYRGLEAFILKRYWNIDLVNRYTLYIM